MGSVANATSRATIGPVSKGSRATTWRVGIDAGLAHPATLETGSNAISIGPPVSRTLATQEFNATKLIVILIINAVGARPEWKAMGLIASAEVAANRIRAMKAFNAKKLAAVKDFDVVNVRWATEVMEQLVGILTNVRKRILATTPLGRFAQITPRASLAVLALGATKGIEWKALDWTLPDIIAKIVGT